MGPIRRFLMVALGARSASAITVGSYMAANGEQNVSMFLAEGWKRIAVRLSSDGTRRLAAQMVEWADAADKHNEELEREKNTTMWKYVVEAAIVDAAKKPDEAAPATSS